RTTDLESSGWAPGSAVPTGGREGCRTSAPSSTRSCQPTSRCCIQATRPIRTMAAPHSSPSTRSLVGRRPTPSRAGAPPGGLLAVCNDRAPLAGAAYGLLLVPDYVHDRVDERQVGKRLREVSLMAT